MAHSSSSPFKTVARGWARSCAYLLLYSANSSARLFLFSLNCATAVVLLASSLFWLPSALQLAVFLLPPSPSPLPAFSHAPHYVAPLLPHKLATGPVDARQQSHPDSPSSPL